MPPALKASGRPEQLGLSIDFDRLPPAVRAGVVKLLDLSGAVAAGDDRVVRFRVPLLEAALACDVVRMSMRCQVYLRRADGEWEPVRHEVSLTLKNPTRLNPAVFPPVLDFVAVAPKIARLV